MNAYLYRYRYTKQYTLGTLYINANIFHTIERPWLDNRTNISCIPKGVYTVLDLPKSASGKYRNVYHLQDVSNRSGILIHNGNLVTHSKGCIILGMKSGTLGGKQAVLQSKSAMRKLNKIAPNGFKLVLC